VNRNGFWHHNMWSLLALLPVAALFAAIALDRTDYFGKQLAGQPHSAVAGAPSDWVGYSQARLRLLALSPTADLYDSGAKRMKLPDAIKAWRAVIEVQADDQKTLADCDMSLEDSAGRLFGSRPDELAGAAIPAPTCTAEDSVLSTYQVTIFFVTPADAKPIAVRVMTRAALPRYARLVVA
jgi:hypothetical protein